jgi:hypothetical protein
LIGLAIEENAGTIPGKLVRLQRESDSIRAGQLSNLANQPARFVGIVAVINISVLRAAARIGEPLLQDTRGNATAAPRRSPSRIGKRPTTSGIQAGSIGIRIDGVCNDRVQIFLLLLLPR